MNTKKLRKYLARLTKLKVKKNGEIHTKLPNFTSFNHDALTCLTLPDNKTYE